MFDVFSFCSVDVKCPKLFLIFLPLRKWQTTYYINKQSNIFPHNFRENF